MSRLRIAGPDLLVERLAAESPLKPRITALRGEPVRADDPAGPSWDRYEAAAIVSLAPWTDFAAQVRDATAFLGAAAAEIARLRDAYRAEAITLEVSVARPVVPPAAAAATTAFPFPAELVAAAARAGIALELALHPPYLSGGAQRHPRIASHPEVCQGRPVVRGTRVTVHAVVGAVADGRPIAAIIEDFPDIEPEDVVACVHFLADQLERA